MFTKSGISELRLSREASWVEDLAETGEVTSAMLLAGVCCGDLAPDDLSLEE